MQYFPDLESKKEQLLIIYAEYFVLIFIVFPVKDIEIKDYGNTVWDNRVVSSLLNFKSWVLTKLFNFVFFFLSAIFISEIPNTFLISQAESIFFLCLFNLSSKSNYSRGNGYPIVLTLTLNTNPYSNLQSCDFKIEWI